MTHLDPPVQEEQGDEGQQDAGRDKHDDQDGSQHRHQAVGEAEHHIPQLDVQGLHVATEAVDEAPHRLRVEEGHRQPQHLLQQLRVQPAQCVGVNYLRMMALLFSFFLFFFFWLFPLLGERGRKKMDLLWQYLFN